MRSVSHQLRKWNEWRQRANSHLAAAMRTTHSGDHMTYCKHGVPRFDGRHTWRGIRGKLATRPVHHPRSVPASDADTLWRSYASSAPSFGDSRQNGWPYKPEAIGGQFAYRSRRQARKRFICLLLRRAESVLKWTIALVRTRVDHDRVKFIPTRATFVVNNGTLCDAPAEVGARMRSQTTRSWQLSAGTDMKLLHTVSVEH